MAALFDEVVSSLGDRGTVRSMAEESPSADIPSLGTAAVLGVPIIISRLTHSLADQGVSQVVLEHLGGIDPEAGANPASDASSDKAAGSEVIDLIFGDGRNEVAGAIASETGISEHQARGVLPTSAWTVLTSVAKQYGNQLDNPSLVTVLNRERRDLMSKGWAQWIEKVSPLAPVAEAAPRPATPPPLAQAPVAPPSVSPRHADLLPSPATDDYEQRPLADPRTGSVRAESLGASPFEEDAGRLSDGSSIGRSGGADASSARRFVVTQDRARPLDDGLGRSDERQGSNKRISVLSLIAGAVLMLGVLALIGWFQSRGDSDTNVADGSGVATTDDDAAEAGSTDDAGNLSQQDVAGDESPAEGDGGDATGNASDPASPEQQQLSYNIEMRDPLQRSDAVGVINLEFDNDAMQVCYGVEATGLGSPYDGHIHVGPPGVKGGIVVDFGPVSSGETACTAVAENDMEAILGQPAIHYVEMHDPSEDFTIRAQMSDDPLPVVQGSVDFNPDGDGATTKISSGRITLEGPVPDQETMDRMIAEVAGLDESRILVVNDLAVVEGADLPTGLITVADSILFAIDSDELVATNTVIEDLALLFKARSDWAMTIVGHTDSTGNDVYNLELSLRRAAAVRDSLASFGVPADRLRTEGAGSRDPVGSNDTEEGRAQNRRIEFRIDRS